MKHYLVFASVLMVTFLSTAGIALPYPILAPLFMDGQVNGLNSFMGISPEVLLGVAMAIYPLGIFIGGTYIGALSDVYGRKPLLVYTLFISVLGYLLTAYAIVTEQYLLFIGARLFTGLCEGNLSIARAIALDLGESIDKTRSMSLISAASFAGWLIGPLAGGYLAEYGAQVAFEAGSGAMLVCLVFVALVIKDTHKPAAGQPFASLLKSHNSMRLLRYPKVHKIFVMQLLYGLGLNALYEFFPVWLVMQRGYQPSMIGEMNAVMTTCMMLTSVLLVTRLKRVFGIEPMLIGSMVVTALLMAIITLLSGLGLVVVFGLVGVAIAIYSGLLPVYASDVNDEVGNGALMGLLTATFCIANAIIAIVGSFVLKVHPSLPMIMGAGLIIASAVLLVRFIAQQSRENTGVVNDEMIDTMAKETAA